MFDITDTIIKGTGNSRTLKSVPNFMTLYPTFEAFGQALVDGELPVDLGPMNAAGVDVFGTDYSKASVLPDSTEKLLWGSVANRNIGQALQQLRSLITTAQTAADGKCKIATGSYVGTGLFGVDNPCSITFPFVPVIAMMPTYSTGGSIADRWLVPIADLPTDYAGNKGFFRYPGSSNILGYGKKSPDGRTLYWYATTSLSNWESSVPLAQHNILNMTYNWVAIG